MVHRVNDNDTPMYFYYHFCHLLKNGPFNVNYARTLVQQMTRDKDEKSLETWTQGTH